MACLDHAQCKSYNFQETENADKSCELSSSTESASSSDLVSRQGYSYSDAEVKTCYVIIMSKFVHIFIFPKKTF